MNQSVFKPDFKADLLAGFLVFLIALPLCLGIAMASGFPPVAGVLTAIIGGMIATFFGSAQLTIKGPAAGLIVIALGAVQALGAGDAVTGYRRAIAIVVVTGAIQIVMALLRAGAMADFFPSSVIHGMLASIGVIIFSKQAHTALGVAPHSKEPLHLLAEIPNSLMHLNPEVAAIGIVSLIILFGLPQLPFSWAKRIPAPMAVLVVAVPLGMLFDLDHGHTYTFAAHSYHVGPEYLVQLPGAILNALQFPDFSQIVSPTSLHYILLFVLVGSIESVLSAKAVDLLDPQRRHNDMNRDLLAVGVGNTISGLIGGLPMISEIVRSSANINNGARSRYANFFHGIFLFLFVALVPGMLHRIPLAALGAMLIYTGIRLSSPQEFVRTFRIGPEQLFVFMGTLLTTLATDLLVGVAAGIVLKFCIHIKNGAPLGSLFRVSAESKQSGKIATLRVSGSAVFSNYLGLRRRIEALGMSSQHVVVDLESTRLVDHTVVEKLHHLVDDWQRAGKKLEVRGLHEHLPLSPHELAARRRVDKSIQRRAA